MASLESQVASFNAAAAACARALQWEMSLWQPGCSDAKRKNRLGGLKQNEVPFASGVRHVFAAAVGPG